jgi:acetylornithine deacetylase/succinyl-diaminopimelate desuccinylase-like protein
LSARIPEPVARIPEPVARVWAVIDAEPDWSVELASRLVRIPSVNPKFPAGNAGFDIAGGEAKVQALLAGELESLGLATRQFDALPGRPNLLAKTEDGGDPARSLILCGHVDVVPIGDLSSWSYPPFCGDIRDGRLLGRGSQDMKAGLAACVGAIRAIRKAGVRLDGQLALHSVVDEEAGGAGAKAMVAAGELAAAAIVAEPANGSVHVSQGGLEWLRVTIRGRQGHSAYRYSGYWPQPHEARTGVEPVSAADIATRFLSALRDYEAVVARTKSHPLMPPGVNHFGVGAMWIGAGLGPDGLPQIMTNPGITPDVAVIDIDMKFLPQETADAARAEFEAFVAAFSATDPWLRAHPIRVQWDLYGLHFPPLNTPADHPLVGAIREARAWLGRPDTPVLGSIGVTDAAHYAAAGVEALRYGPFGANQHGADEWADVASIRETTRALAAAVLDWCGVRPANRG